MTLNHLDAFVVTTPATGTASGQRLAVASASVRSRCIRSTVLRSSIIALSLLSCAAPLLMPSPLLAQSSSEDAGPIKSRNLGVSRVKATPAPRSEGDQAVVDGWPLYRTERGQTAFNDTMATLKASDGTAPAVDAFKGCNGLECALKLPAIGSDGWIPAGRVWVSPTEYVLFSHSPRLRTGQSYRRRGFRDMRYFVFHEFHNGSRNTDPYDTISSHSSSVFVPFYMSKPARDAKGHHFVAIVQIAPYDVVSIHASNLGNAGSGIEVAKNFNEQMEPLQGLAGIVVASIVKAAAPHIKVVNHRGAEGQPMLQVYERRLAAIANRSGATPITLPFVPAPPQRLQTAAARLDDLILRRGMSPRIPIAERGIVPPKPLVSSMTADAAPAKPARLSPLATYLRANLATMKRLPDYVAIFPKEVTAIAEEAPDDGIVYLLDADQQILGRIVAHKDGHRIVPGRYVYAPIDRAIEEVDPFELDLSRPAAVRAAALAGQPGAPDTPQLVEPIRPASPPVIRTGR